VAHSPLFSVDRIRSTLQCRPHFTSACPRARGHQKVPVRCSHFFCHHLLAVKRLTVAAVLHGAGLRVTVVGYCYCSHPWLVDELVKLSAWLSVLLTCIMMHACFAFFSNHFSYMCWLAGSVSFSGGGDGSAGLPSVEVVLDCAGASHWHPVDQLVELLAVAPLNDAACSRVLSIIGNDKVVR
jgi:hypothetical protein